MAMALVDWNVGHTMKKDKTEAGEDSSSINIISSSKIFSLTSGWEVPIIS